MPDPASTRSAEYVVPIAAPADAVWRALTDPRELERWFPFTASVTPGVGGEYVLRWRDRHAGDDWPILAWEPARHLRIGMPKPPGAPAPAHIVTDFELESHGGRTTLRVVASGFDPDARWETFFDGIRRGWRFELLSLRHYLEHHRGESRVVAWARTPFQSTNDEMWSRLFGPGGWVPDRPLDQLGEGERYRLTAPDGTVVSGTVFIVDRPTDFTGSVDEINGGVLRVQLDPARVGGHVGLWLAAYGVPPGRMEAVERSWQAALASLVTPVVEHR